MKNKQTDINLKGILNSLEDTSEDHQEENTTVIIEDEEMKKRNRSFMLTNATIKQLKELNFVIDKDLGTIVTEAIDMYHKSQKKEISKYMKK